MQPYIKKLLTWSCFSSFTKTSGLALLLIQMEVVVAVHYFNEMEDLDLELAE
jgi:hypothetical protein